MFEAPDEFLSQPCPLQQPIFNETGLRLLVNALQSLFRRVARLRDKAALEFLNLSKSGAKTRKKDPNKDRKCLREIIRHSLVA